MAALIALGVAPATNGPDACKKATERFNAAKAHVEAATQDYAKCVAGSTGRHSCTVEFDEVEIAQERLEAAVADYRGACP